MEQVDQWKQQPLMTETLREQWRKIPKYQSLTSQTHLHRAGEKVSQSTVQRWRREQEYKGYTTRCKPLIRSTNRKGEITICKEVMRWATKVLGQSFMDCLTSTKVMERPVCGERRDLLMIQNIQINLWSTVEEVSWLGLAWLLLEWAH